MLSRYLAAVSSLSLLLAPASFAGAQEPDELESVKITFGDPGEIYFECDSFDAMVEAPEVPRVFADWLEYADFLETKLNAIPRWTEAGEIAGFSLHSRSCCQTLFLAPGVWEPLATDRPARVILGGVSGYVVVKGQAICVNPDLCDPEGVSSPQQIFEDQSFSTMAGVAGSLFSVWGTTIDGMDYQVDPYLQTVIAKTLVFRSLTEEPFCCQYGPQGCVKVCAPPASPTNAHTITQTLFGYESGEPLFRICKKPFWDFCRTIGYTPVTCTNKYQCTQELAERYNGPGEELHRDPFIFNSTIVLHEAYRDDGEYAWDGSCTAEHRLVPCP